MIPLYKPWITEEDTAAVTKAVASGWVSSKGREVNEFEAAFARYVGSKYALSCSSGTTALHLALLATDVDFRVVIPNITFVATANVVEYVSAIAEIVDIDEYSWNMDETQLLEKYAEAYCDAVIPVHLYGSLCKIPNNVSTVIIEDAAEALGTWYEGKHAGTFGDVGCFSFFGNKVITTGEGGMLVTDNQKIYEKAALLRGQGQTRQYFHEVVGYNYRMTNMQAALGLSQLSRIDEILRRKEKIAEQYRSLLGGKVAFQYVPYATNNWLVVIKTDNAKVVVDNLTHNGIETRPVFTPLTKMPPWSGFYGDFPQSEDLHNKGICLPSYPELEEKDVEYICNIISRWC